MILHPLHFNPKSVSMKKFSLVFVLALLFPIIANATCPYDSNCLSNPYGAGSPYRSNGLMNPYSNYGSRYSNNSWTNPYATNAPKIYDEQGNYRGRLSSNPYDPDSTSNRYGRYGNKFSTDSINNPFNRSQNYYVVGQ